MDRLTKLPSYSSSKLLNTSNLFLVSAAPAENKMKFKDYCDSFPQMQDS